MKKQEWKPGNMLYPVPAVMVSCGREGETPNNGSVGRHDLQRSGDAFHFRSPGAVFL